MKTLETAGRFCVFLASAVAFAGGDGAPVPQSSERTFSHVCDSGMKVSVAYVEYGRTGPSFAVMNWNGAQYGLVSTIGGGARYAVLAGPEGARGGLKW